jgi:hypothetical protein
MPVAYAVTPGDYIEIGMRLSLEVSAVYDDIFGTGDFIAYGDFANTAEFIGFQVWEDAEMTRAVTSGVTIIGSTGEVNIVPIPGAVWLFGSGLVALFGWGRCKRVGVAG